MQIHPFKALRATEESAPHIADLPYDVVDIPEVRARVEAEPRSFLAVDVPAAAFEDGHDPYGDDVYEEAARAFDALFDEGDIVEDEDDAFYVYRQVTDGHMQTGVFALLDVADYDSGRIAKHENTRVDKENDRVNHIMAVGAQTGPIFLTYRERVDIDDLVGQIVAGEPLFDFDDAYGCRNIVWKVSDPKLVEGFETAFGEVERFYIADGHHRTASAARVAKAKGQAYATFMCVMVPDGDLDVLAYNRVVADLNGHTPASFREAVETAGFKVTPLSEPLAAVEPGSFMYYTHGAWHLAQPEEYLKAIVASAAPQDALDVAVLQNRVLEPVLGIANPREDPRIAFIGGVKPLSDLERAAGRDGVAFAMAPTAVDELMAVADKGELMPPKSTWFEPKLRSGLIFNMI
jgi:uncharacterized protein (DUF1015 family)